MDAITSVRTLLSVVAEVEPAWLLQKNPYHFAYYGTYWSKSALLLIKQLLFEAPRGCCY